MKAKIPGFIVFALSSCAIAAFLGIAEGISWKICVPVSAAFFVICIVISIVQEYGNKKSFKTAAALEKGEAFKSEHQQKRYEKWKQKKNSADTPKGTPLHDIILRYRSWSIVWEILGALALLLMLLIVYSELETGVRYILLGGAIILLYLAASDTFGIRARRLYSRITALPDFADIERSYSESTLTGFPKNWIAFSREYIILLTPKAIIPIPRDKAVMIRRAFIVGGTNYNGAVYSSATDSEKYYIRVYMNDAGDPFRPAYYTVMLGRFGTELAFEMLGDLGYPTDQSIDAR